MRKLVITNIDCERNISDLTHHVLLRGTIMGVHVQVDTVVYDGYHDTQVAIEHGIQECIRKLLKALEPEEVVYEKEAEDFAKKLHAMGPIHTNPHAVGIPSSGFVHRYSQGWVKPNPLDIPHVPVSGTNTLVVNNAAQTATTSSTSIERN